MKYNILFLSFFTTMFLTACGDGYKPDASSSSGGGSSSPSSSSSSSSSTTTSSLSSISSGSLVDSAVEGIYYVAGNTASTQLTGFTDADGVYQYYEGENITFYIGNTSNSANLVLGNTVTAKSRMMPSDLTSDDIAKYNMARLLQNLDSDGNTSNGIEINSTVQSSAAGLSVDFQSPYNSFVSDNAANLTTLFGTSISTDADLDINITTATAHLDSSANEELNLTLVENKTFHALLNEGATYAKLHFKGSSTAPTNIDLVLQEDLDFNITNDANVTGNYSISDGNITFTEQNNSSNTFKMALLSKDNNNTELFVSFDNNYTAGVLQLIDTNTSLTLSNSDVNSTTYYMLYSDGHYSIYNFKNASAVDVTLNNGKLSKSNYSWVLTGDDNITVQVTDATDHFEQNITMLVRFQNDYRTQVDTNQSLYKGEEHNITSWTKENTALNEVFVPGTYYVVNSDGEVTQFVYQNTKQGYSISQANILNNALTQDSFSWSVDYANNILNTTYSSSSITDLTDYIKAKNNTFRLYGSTSGYTAGTTTFKEVFKIDALSIQTLDFNGSVYNLYTVDYNGTYAENSERSYDFNSSSTVIDSLTSTSYSWEISNNKLVITQNANTSNVVKESYTLLARLQNTLKFIRITRQYDASGNLLTKPDGSKRISIDIVYMDK